MNPAIYYYSPPIWRLRPLARVFRFCHALAAALVVLLLLCVMVVSFVVLAHASSLAVFVAALFLGLISGILAMRMLHWRLMENVPAFAALKAVVGLDPSSEEFQTVVKALKCKDSDYWHTLLQHMKHGRGMNVSTQQLARWKTDQSRNVRSHWRSSSGVTFSLGKEGIEVWIDLRRGYRGDLPGDLERDATVLECIEKLGVPTEEGGSRSGSCVLIYEGMAVATWMGKLDKIWLRKSLPLSDDGPDSNHPCPVRPVIGPDPAVVAQAIPTAD